MTDTLLQALVMIPWACVMLTLLWLCRNPRKAPPKQMRIVASEIGD